MAFSNIEKDEMLKVFSIAVVSNDNLKEQEIYKETLEKLSTGDARLFNLKYVAEEEANRLLDESEIEGYVVISDDVKVVIKENGSNQTIIKFVIQEIKQNNKIVEDLSLNEIEKETSNGNYSFDTTEIVNNILTKINSQEVSLNSLSSSNLSYMTIEYYTLIAMACMYTGMLGLTSINNCLANMSNKGKRISGSPNKKSTIVLSSLIGSYIVSLLGLSILLLFLLFVLKVDFGNNMLLVILLSMIGSLAGISLGVLVASVFKLSEGAKTGIIIAISMFLSVLSGMTGVTLKYVIDTNVPIVNLINPNNLITDGFYSLYYYNTLDRYFRDLIYLIIFVIICLVISFFSLRREQYDSI